MNVREQLENLESYFVKITEENKIDYVELYTKVQYTIKIIPRLYMLILCGIIHIKSKKIKPSIILNDIIQFIKGIQNPIRGLFIHDYLIHKIRHILPDINNDYKSEGESTEFSINYILTNLSDMNNLWCKMIPSAKSRNIELKNNERNDVKMLIGSNLDKLSHLDGLSLELYKNCVLPSLSKIIVNSKDAMSQEYLLNCIIDTFPNEYHLCSMKELMEILSQLNVNINYNAIIEPLLKRIIDYYKEYKTPTTTPNTPTPEQEQTTATSSNTLIPDNEMMIKIFKEINDGIIHFIEVRPKMKTQDILHIEYNLIYFIMKTFGKDKEAMLIYVENIFKYCCQIIIQRSNKQKMSNEIENEIVNLLSLTLKSYNIELLNIESFETVYLLYIFV